MEQREKENSLAASAPAGTDLAAPDRRVVRRAPLVAAAIAMAAGILAGRYVWVPLGVWAVLGVGAFAAAAVALRRSHLHLVTAAGIAVSIFCASAAAGAMAYRHVPPNHIVTFSGQGSVLATIRGRVASAPLIRQPPTAFWQPPRTTFLLNASHIRRTDGQWADTRGRVRVKVGEPVHDLAAGDKLELIGALRRVRGPNNPGQYDWKAAERYRGILVRFNVPGAEGVRRSAPAGRSPISGIRRRLRGLLRRHISGCGDPEEAILVRALVLGERDPALQELNRAMVEAGIAHFLSISGLHLGIFLGFIYGLLRVLMFRPRRAAGVVLIVLLTYVLLAEPRAPLLRGAVMAAAFCVATLSGRSISTANALAAAAILLLLADPLQLFTPGFQLSFGIVCGIVLLYRPVRQMLFGRWLRRRGLIVFRDPRGGHRLRRWLYYRGADWVIRPVSLSVSAYVAAVPLVAYHFGLFSPYAPLLSILLLPLITAVLIPAYVSMALAWPMPNLAAAIGDLAGSAAGASRQIVLLLHHLPGLSFEVFQVPAWLILLCYAAVGLWVVAGRYRRAVPAALVATAAALAVAAVTQRPAPAPPAGQLHVLDVSHGSMVLLYAPDGKTYLFDAGTMGQVSPYHDILRPFLRARRLPSPEVVFVSHANFDHYNALPDLAQRRRPRSVHLNEFFGRRPDDPPGVRRLVTLFGERGVEVVRLRRGQKIQLGPKTHVEVLWPPSAAEAPDLEANDSSLVLRLVCRGRSVLIPGDIGEAVEAELAKLPPEQIRSDVLLLPHHGSYTPTLKTFIEAVGADILIQSSSFPQERQETLAAFVGRTRYATFRDGWIAVDLARDRLRVTTLRNR